ncbi:hypothetical protein FB45DRAFT_1061966 [Roridomyces roridus]|uniref:Uncharacterized protein n=1 Tax=Roridomyces roridus TaxID=1738132 RepID=A0AAD7BJB5_9AGAR|nr:hypothetical protein FB45DRAFT_1061966 [Roridomyces roridus]
MVRNLPDEIIHEILSPALDVPEQEFSTTLAHTSYVRPIESTSAILLVSKSWLRVATPLLYNVVILRSRGQVQALELALHSSPELGKFIKKLRIEGGYTVALEKILAKADLTDICLTLEVKKGENAKGICRGLSLINPVRVILAYYPSFISKSVRNMLDALTECMPKWTNLTGFTMCHDPSIRALVMHNDILAEALKSAPNLRTVILPGLESTPFFGDQIPKYLLALATIPSLQEIRSQTRARRALRPEWIQTLRKSPRLAALIDLTLLDAVPKKTFLYPLQLAADPALEDNIWDRILSFVYTTNDHRPPISAWYHGVASHDFEDYDFYLNSETDFNDWMNRPPKCVRPLLVCKRFLRLGTPYMYRRPVTHTPEKLPSLLRKLAETPLLGQHVRQLCLREYVHKNMADTSRLLSHLPQLRSLTGSLGDRLSLPWKLFDELSVRCGETLDTFEGLGVDQPEDSKPVDPIIFSRLDKMRFLAWSSDVVFATTSEELQFNDMFPTLEELTIDRADASFYMVLSQMELPSLRCVIFAAEEDSDASDSHVFFKKHGGKLEKLIVSDAALDADIVNCCPSIQVLSIVSQRAQIRSPVETFKQCDNHPLLERIVFRTMSGSVQTDENGDKHPDKFISTFDRTPFPALREIEHPVFKWNLPEAEMAKHAYVKWAEKFQKEGVDLVQSPGANTMELHHVEIQPSTSPSCHHLVHTAVTRSHTAHLRPGEPQTTVLNATLALRTSSQISRSLPMLMPACTLSASAAADHCTSQAYHVPPAGCLPSPGPRFYITLAVKTFPRSRPTPFIQRPSASAAAAPIALPVGPW